MNQVLKIRVTLNYFCFRYNNLSKYNKKKQTTLNIEDKLVITSGEREVGGKIGEIKMYKVL